MRHAPPIDLWLRVFSPAALCFVFSCPGCTRNGQGQPAEKTEAQVMTAGDARQALADLLETTDYDELGMSLASLKAAHVKVFQGGQITIGVWRCDLRKRTFSVTVDADPIFADYSGSFEPSSDGKWRAVIRRVTRN